MIHDIGSTYQHRRQRFEDKKPFTEVDDARLIWFHEDFIPWLDIWHETDTDTFLTEQTYEALRIKTLCTVELVRRLLNSGFQFVLTRRLTSDTIERLFSSMRQSSGGNFDMETKAAVSALKMRSHFISVD